MSAIDPSTPRNAPCPCGCGQKYKRCHGAENATGGEAPASQENPLARTLFIISALVSIGVGVAFEPQKGLGLFGASVIAIGAYAIFRNPPPPKSGGDDPAAINFGG